MSFEHPSHVLFLSTPSARRATLDQLLPKSAFGHFYPRPPRGGRPPSPRFARGGAQGYAACGRDAARSTGRQGQGKRRAGRASPATISGLACRCPGRRGKPWRVSRPVPVPRPFFILSLGVFFLSVPFSSHFAGSSPAVFCPLPSGSGASAGGFAVACRAGRSSRVWWLVVASVGPSGVSFRWASARASRSLFASPAVAASAGSLAIWGGLGWPGGASSGRVRVVRCLSFGVPVPVWAGF